MSDMTALLNGLSYIPSNNEHNETSNEPTQATRNDFKELYASANEELYPGCDYVTRLYFMEKFTYFKVKDSNTPGKKVPKKVLRYFLIIPRLQRLYKSSYTAKEMIWHAIGKCTELGKMQHPVHGGAWKKFVKEPRNVRLGPKSLGKDIDVYLRPLIEDLKVLWDRKGVKTKLLQARNIINVVNEDDNIIDDEDAIPHDLADSDDEDLINVNDDADVARSHGGDGGGEDRPPPYHVATGCGGCFANRGKGNGSNLGAGQWAG
ncbi:hypothetical protein Tco_1087238 [Tanacetum coccineum]